VWKDKAAMRKWKDNPAKTATPTFIRSTTFPVVRAQKTLRGFRLRGGGGLDFRPAIAEAAKWRPDSLIYLTDLQRDASDEPAFPVLWSVPEGKTEAPWGKIVKLC
jgi:hypothetical protein